MNSAAGRFAVIVVGIALLCARSAAAQIVRNGSAPPVRSEGSDGKKKLRAAGRLVAYDAHDRRYYDLTWAKERRMRDPAGDVLVILPLNRLPQGTNPAIAFPITVKGRVRPQSSGRSVPRPRSR